MFETRKQLIDDNAKLIKKVNELEEALTMKRHNELKTGFIDAAGLPPCKSLLCINCEHFVCVRGSSGGVYPLGCGKDIDCPDFKRADNALSAQEKQSLQREMLLQSQS